MRLSLPLKRMMKFIDIGANLTDPMYEGIYNGSQKHPSDLRLVLCRAHNIGVERIIVTVGSPKLDLPRAKEIIATDPNLYITIGVHPTRCNEFDVEGPEKYMELLSTEIEANRGRVVALGELGLDYDRTRFCEKDIQKKYFEKQLELADKYELPLFLHCRGAHEDFFDILNRNREKVKKGGVVHSFDGTLEDAQRYIDFGLHVGINGCSLKTEENLKVVAQLPDEKILIETDAPWCEIRPTHAGFKHVKTKFEYTKRKDKWNESLMIGGRCEPTQIIQVAEVIAAIKGKDMKDLAERYYENTLKLFFTE